MGTVTISKEEYASLVCMKNKLEILKSMIVTSEIQTWEQALIILGDMAAYDTYITAKLEDE